MEFRSPGEIGIPSSSPGYSNPSLARGGSAFSKPTLSSSPSLLISPRAGGASSGGGGAKNSNVFGHTQPPPPPPPPPGAATTTTELVIDLGRNADQSSISNSSPSAAAAGASANSKTKSSATTAAADFSVRYRECLRNHAAAMGGHVVDGCGEFMPASSDADTPEALKCAACGCHRSFHRREPDGGLGPYFHGAPTVPLLPTPILPQSQPQPQSHLHHHQKQFQFGGFVQFSGHNPSGSGGTTTESSSEERTNAGAPSHSTVPRKRFRTKFTAEQKEKMQAFAERIEWRIQRQDYAMVEQFCEEIGVRRQVLKVWMHNNKHTITRNKQQQQPPPPPPPETQHLI